MMKKLFFIFFLLSGIGELHAAVFTVTSNGDSDGGTLREAITLANANGTLAKDYIYFNLPGNSLGDITIALQTELPILTSNIVIDGTTQPFSVLGDPNIKISLIRVATNYFNGLRLDNANDIEIYGLSFSNFKSDPLGAIDDKKAGIFLYSSSNVIIGAPNKPNCFGGNYAGVLSPFVIPRAAVQNVKISSNIFGLAENGIGVQSNEIGIDLSFLTNSIIGGDTPEEGNLITSNTKNGIALGGADGNIKISNNVIGLVKTLASTVPSAVANGVYVNGDNCVPIIANNVIGGQAKGIMIDYVNGGFVVSNNKIGTGLLGTENFGNSIGVHVNFCNKGLIGGNATSGNAIANNKTAVLIEISYPISILGNSLYCNNVAVTFKNLPAGKSVTQPRITSITINEVSGTYLPNSKIELFYTDSCPDCQGKTWFATVLTDASGGWSYTGTIAGKVTSMGTNPDGATSTFSKPLIVNQSAVITGVVCGQTTGSIAIDVFDASVFQWYNSANQLVGSSRVLTNVGAGTYYLKAGQLGACDVVSDNFVIDASSNGINDLQKVIANASCGLSNGSITKITVANNLTRTWYNSSGQVVGTADDLINVPAGTYYFKAGSGSCEVVSNNYKVDNINTVYKAKTVEVTPATCNNNNGGINIIGYETEKPDGFEWFDSQGTKVGVAESLANVSAGKYTLVAHGNNGCTNTVGEFEVLKAPLPSIDYTMLQRFVSCDGKTIGTLGIAVNGMTGPYRYKWLDENNSVVSEQLNLTGVVPGVYLLEVTDKYGCTINGQPLNFKDLAGAALNVPNTFTPNGDGINDTWQIKGAMYYPYAEFSLYNRNGSRVFYAKGYNTPFNGTFNGKTLPAGVYYYVIDLKTDCDKLSGSLTIIR